MERCVDTYIFLGLAVYGAACCTVALLYQCVHDRPARAAHSLPPLVESPVVKQPLREPPPYSAVV